MPAITLEVRNLSVHFGSLPAVDDVSFTAAPGEILGLLGPSGCGKSTTLKAITGLLPASSGDVLFDGRSMRDVPPHRRGVGMVFQSYALFPHMTVVENLRFGLRMQGVPRGDQNGRIFRTLEMMRIAELAQALPDRLSGGQQQRVALARALIAEPALILFDEALSALDRQLRDAMRDELKALLKSIGITAVVVTHDQDEALVMCDRIAVMRNARIEQLGPPHKLYTHPRNRFVAKFLGRANILSGRMAERQSDRILVKLQEDSVVELPCHDMSTVGDAIEFMVRPEFVYLEPAGRTVSEHSSNRLTATLKNISFLGEHTIVTVKLRDGTELVSSTRDSGALKLSNGDAVIVHWQFDAGTLLEADTNALSG